MNADSEPLSKITGWGRTPRHRAALHTPRHGHALPGLLALPHASIARGLGRAYGDSALSDRVLDLSQMDRVLEFDAHQGRLVAEAGLSLERLLRLIVPAGWFLPVTPGTCHITLGGAVASDVHGKNHHHDGSFSDHLEGIELWLGANDRRWLTREQDAELFHASCGGMGLTGVISRVALRLIPIQSSTIIQRTQRADNLDELLDLQRDWHEAPYLVSWVDCLARGRALGRGVAMAGRHSDSGPLAFDGAAPKRSIPKAWPGVLLNRASMRAFNGYYWRQQEGEQAVDLSDFFYPLDSIANWPRLYGRQGFYQYQCVLPEQAGREPLRELFERIAAAGCGSFLAVLKLMGPGNGNPLSFPMQGPTLAVDFKADERSRRLMNELDAVVAAAGGRIYLTKDARLQRSHFDAGYPQADDLRLLRRELGLDERFQSLQSRRLEL